MDYLQRHLPDKADSKRWAPRARSAIVIAKNYFPHPYPAQKASSLRTAFYAQGEDYHDHFKNELEALAAGLRLDFVSDEFLCFTDSAPVLERDLAARAGLGWIGKNSCLIHPQKGSLFFIGEILTSVELKGPSALVPDHCGTCDRCIQACPTQAFEAPRVLNASKCIAYWTIESKAAAPVELRTKFGDWFFGCDICQTVCPWNEKVFGKASFKKNPESPREDKLQELRWILTSSHKALMRANVGLPYARARANGLKRNALYQIANQKLSELQEEVRELRTDPRYSELAEWTLTKLEVKESPTSCQP